MGVTTVEKMNEDKAGGGVKAMISAVRDAIRGRDETYPVVSINITVPDGTSDAVMKAIKDVVLHALLTAGVKVKD
jgi:hypothetical protein